MENRLKEIRKSRKITQEELGEMIGSTKMHIWRLERGDRQLTQKWLLKISKALNCSILDILPQSDSNNQNIEKDEFSDLSEEEKNLIRTFRKVKETSENKENTKAS
jgi:putative transcriptional regulator